MAYAENVIVNYRRKGALIDANLLLLLFVGSYKRELVGRFKRVQKFVPEDYDLIARVAAYFSPLVTTPNILTEVSNLAGSLSDNDRENFFLRFREMLTLVGEQYIPAAGAMSSVLFVKLGLTDAAIEVLARGKYLVITEDFELSQRLSKIGVDTLNFNHLRSFNWTRN